MPTKIIYLFGGYAYGYKNVALWAEEGDVADKVSVGRLNGTLYIDIETIPNGYNKYLMGFRSDTGNEYRMLLTEKHYGGRQHKWLFKVISRDELLENFEIHPSEMYIAKDNDQHIVITKQVLDYFEELQHNYEENVKLFNEQSIDPPPMVAKEVVDDMDAQIKTLTDENNKLREQIRASKQKIAELEVMLRDCDNQRYDSLISYMAEHPNARAQSLLKRFS